MKNSPVSLHLHVRTERTRHPYFSGYVTNVIDTISNFSARKRRCRSVGGRAAKYTKITLKMVSHVSLYRYSTMYEEVPGVMRFKILENEFLV